MEITTTYREVPFIPISELGLSNRAMLALLHNGIYTVEHLVELQSEPFRRLRGIGTKIQNEIHAKLGIATALTTTSPQTTSL